ncbi:helix-turn-helix domain-containing protein [Rothia sp. P3C3.S176]|uniref:AlbA family DNA-binding domain-containing protein n=1 Tax=Rothia sp. P3C3.S176 TaxID=2962204 RepID=UPI0020C8C65E|nr:ATP-binding protein [Rothia sp. P3C3.S176]MCP8995093.1 ATP-binding protein [Rothia sp. P3C3.S176]
MFTPIHRALGLEPGDLTLELIEKAIEAGLEETADFDMKRVVPNLKEDKSKQEIAKDIAAMANSGGGWIIYGVGEGASDIAESIHPCEWTATEEQQMLNIAYTKIDPPVVGLEFNKISCGENSDKKLVLMHIPDSVDAPHFAREEKNNFSAPRRNGPHTKPMTYRDIERGFRERFQRRAEQEKTLQGYFEQATEALNPEQGVFLAIAAVPVTPKISAGSVDRDKAIQHTNPWAYSYLIASRRGNCSKEEKIETEFNFIWNQGEHVKGMRRWVIRNLPQTIAGKYRKYLHDDGTLLGAYQLGGVYNKPSASNQYPVGKPNHCRSKDIESALIDFFSILREHAKERRVSGGFRIRVGLVGDSNSPILVRTFDGFMQVLTEESYSEPIKRFQPVSTFIDPLAPIEDILSPLRILALDIVNQGGIQSLQIIAGEES